MLPRRTLIQAGAAFGTGLATGFRVALAAGKPAVILMTSSPDGSCVGFDPVGILIQPGQTVSWRCQANVHTATAYHPANSGHSLRIPKGAEPWNSGLLLPGKSFEHTFTVPGVYDFFCEPHEAAGMVGRIIVGHPAGPGTLPFDYFEKLPDHPHWLAVPAAARDAFPEIAAIMKNRRVEPKMPCSSIG